MKEQFNIKKEYKESWNYLKQSKNFIYAAIGIFLFFVLFGFFVPAPDFLSEKIMKFIQELLEKTSGLSPLELIYFIFLNNIQSSFFGMIFGILFGVFPLIAIIFNGYVLGFVSSMSIQKEGFFVLWRLLPHGIFELPALFISLGLGLKLGSFVFNKNIKKSFKEYLINSIKVFLLIIIPLLIIAAFIEGGLISFLGN